MSYLSGWGIPVVEVLFIRVHPNLCSSYSILEEVGPCIRGLFREHMAYMRAGVNLEAATALPHLTGLNTWHTIHETFVVHFNLIVSLGFFFIF